MRVDVRGRERDAPAPVEVRQQRRARAARAAGRAIDRRELCVVDLEQCALPALGRERQRDDGCLDRGIPRCSVVSPRLPWRSRYRDDPIRGSGRVEEPEAMPRARGPFRGPSRRRASVTRPARRERLGERECPRELAAVAPFAATAGGTGTGGGRRHPCRPPGCARTDPRDPHVLPRGRDDEGVDALAIDDGRRGDPSASR